MSTELIRTAIARGAKLYASISGGKDGDAMVEALVSNGFPIRALVHADLGRVEWPQSWPQCIKASRQFKIPLHVVRRADRMDLLARWRHRMKLLEGTGKPFWSSSKARYCTSDLKRNPINVYFTSTNESFVISCEGIRADESTARAKKIPLEIRSNSSEFYRGMTVEQAIENFDPRFKLFLTWFPIFNYSTADVWAAKGMQQQDLDEFRIAYKETGMVDPRWPFHPAYVFGNERVSCMICVLATINDMQNGAKHNPGLLEEMIEMEIQGNATFKNKWSLTQLKLSA